MHRFLAVLESSITVTEQNREDRVRYIMRPKIFDDVELEQLRREAVPSSNENTTTGDAAIRIEEQTAHVDTTVGLLAVDSDDDVIVAQEQEQTSRICIEYRKL
ncbi:unnamed protein product [Parnassius apollo]|uniref:(apollo) hypothetical protein n=1 Tax=Parnassius apollo TaxID=110799 RepID=A0A8S3WMB6_PARAO|nr:unnamed protein product [Parnassius apollo]